MTHVEEITFVDPAEAFAGVAAERFSLFLDSALFCLFFHAYSK